MPHFFFHLRDREDLYEDEDGIELPDLSAALEEALRADRELTLEPVGLYGLEFEITDSRGCIVLRVPIQERRRNPDLLPSCSPVYEEKRSLQQSRQRRLLQ